MRSVPRSPLSLALFAFVCAFAWGSLAPQTADAQIWRRAKERAQERLKQRAEERVDRAIDSAVDSAVDKAWDRAEERVAGAAASAAGGAAAKLTNVSPPADLDLGPIASSPRDAEAITYRETTVTESPMLGIYQRMMDQPEPEVTTVFLTPTRARYDDGTSFTLVDAEAGTFTSVDHEARSYVTMTTDQMVTQVAEAQSQMQRQAEEMQGEGTRQRATLEGVEYDMAVSAEVTGREEEVLGIRARQSIVVVETKVNAREAAQADGQSTEEAENAQFQIVTLIEAWTAPEVAGAGTMQAFSERMASQFGTSAKEAFGSGGSSDFSSLAMLGMMPQDAEAASAAAQEALENLEGFPVRTTIHLVLVPIDKAFDAEAVLRGEGAGPNAMQALMGDSGPDTSREQIVLTRTTTHVSNLQPVSPDAADFTIPEGYRAGY